MGRVCRSDFHPHPSPKSQIRAFGIKTCVFALGHDRHVFLIWIPPCSLREAVVSESGVGHTPGRPGQGPGVLPRGGSAPSALCPALGGLPFSPCVRFLPRESGNPGGDAGTARKQAEPGVPPPPSLQAVQGQLGLLDPSPLPSRGESNNLHIIISTTRVLPLREEMLPFNRFLNKINGFPL